MASRAELQAAIAVLTAQVESLPPEPVSVAPALYMTAGEFARHLRVSPRTVRRLLKEGLPSIRPRPKLIRIHAVDAAAWMEKRARSATVAATRGTIQ